MTVHLILELLVLAQVHLRLLDVRRSGSQPILVVEWRLLALEVELGVGRGRGYSVR